MWKDKVIRWQRLDNAAKIFPALVTREDSEVFRITCQLNEPVNPSVLQLAVEDTLDEYPMFRCVLKNGFFWNYYERNETECPVNHDIKNHCYRINFKENNGYLFRVYYHSCRISIDIYHALCDGYGAAVFTALTGNVTADKKLMDRLSQDRYDLLLVNIVADVIIGLAPTLPQFMDADTTLICSGILDTRLSDVLSALKQAGLSVIHTRAKEDWRCVVAKRRSL